MGWWAAFSFWNVRISSWETYLEAYTKSTLNLLNFEQAKFGIVHYVWRSCGTEPFAVKRACVKSKILCGTYTLQADRAKFDKHRSSPLCPLCLRENEAKFHFLDTNLQLEIESLTSGMCFALHQRRTMLIQWY